MEAIDLGKPLFSGCLSGGQHQPTMWRIMLRQRKKQLLYILIMKAQVIHQLWIGTVIKRWMQYLSVSDEVRTHFLNCYPVYSDKTMVFHNIIDLKKIQKLASKGTGFEDQYDGLRILTVGRLTYQKAYDIAVEAMKLVKNAGCRARWYVLGEGDEHRMLERKIEHLGLTDDFLLLGAKENPYPYYANADLYVHATRFEGKSIAIQEAQTLGVR